MASHEGLLEISGEPDPLLHLLASQEVLSFLHEFICSHLDVLIEQVTSEDLLSVLVVDQVRSAEQEAESALGHELVVFIVEEGIVVVEEQELSS